MSTEGSPRVFSAHLPAMPTSALSYVTFYASIALCIGVVVLVVLHMRFEMTGRRHQTYTIAILACLVLALVCVVVGAVLDARANSAEYDALVERIEAKYDIEITSHDKSASEREPRHWTIDGASTSCYVEGVTNGTGAGDLAKITDPVLRCDGEPKFPEIGSGS